MWGVGISLRSVGCMGFSCCSIVFLVATKKDVPTFCGRSVNILLIVNLSIQ